MALTGTGAHMAYQDAGNGRLTFKWAGGNPVFTDDETDLVMSLIMESPWFGDAAGKRRSQLPTVNTKDASTPGRLKQYALDALQPAIDDGRLKSASVAVTALGNGYSLAVAYVTRANETRVQTVELAG